MSFSSLPPELVHQIIESTVPHTYHSTTYKERQRILCSLSLVSSLFRSIAQPLLLEIVALNRLKDLKEPAARALGDKVQTHGLVRWIVITWRGSRYIDLTQEEEDRFAECLRVFQTTRCLTLSFVGERNFADLVLRTSHHLNYLQLTDQHSKAPEGLHLPHLHSLTLYHVSSELVCALVNPTTVPNLRNFAIVDRDVSSVEKLVQSRLDQLLPQLATLALTIELWSDLRAAFLHAAASRTLVDFCVGDSVHLVTSPAHPRHVRLRYTSLLSRSFSHVELQAQLEQWSSLIENTPSLPLQSIYLDSSLRPLHTLPDAVTRCCLENLAQVCKEHEIDLVFEASPVNFSLDPYISEEFIRRQGQQRRKEAEGRGEIVG